MDAESQIYQAPAERPYYATEEVGGEPDLTTAYNEEAPAYPPDSSYEYPPPDGGSRRFLFPAVIVIFFLLIALLVFSLLRCRIFKCVPADVSLIYWGLWEDESVFAPLIADYQKNHPNVKIKYLRQSQRQYRERLSAALLRSDAPDIFRFHNTWLPVIKGGAAPIPQKIISNSEYEKIFYPVTKTDLKIGNSYYGIPLMFEGLALFYNLDVFEKNGLSPPSNWNDFNLLAGQLTRKESGRIVFAGTALGATANVEHWPDILGLLFYQNKVPLPNIAGDEAVAVVKFYRLFAQPPNNTWDENMPNSITAFAGGNTAMIFAPSWEVFEIKALNPALRFGVAPVPQGQEVNASWASYWVEGVSAKSKYKEVAFDFLKFISNRENLTKLYSNQAGSRGMGEIYSRVDLAAVLASDPYLGPFIAMAPNAKSWYLSGRTWDQAINDKIIKYLEDALNNIAQGQAEIDALNTANQGVAQILSQYGAK